MGLDGTHDHRLILDLDRPASPFGADEARCDYLLFIQPPEAQMCVVPLELKGGSARTHVVDQLQAGARASPIQSMCSTDQLGHLLSPASKPILLLLALAVLGACATQPLPPLATPETFESVPCDELARLKYDLEVKLLKLSTNLERTRTAGPRGSTASNGLSELGISLQNLARSMRLTEITDEITAVRVEIAAIDYNLSNRCGRPSVQDVTPKPNNDLSIDPE